MEKDDNHSEKMEIVLDEEDPYVAYKKKQAQQQQQQQQQPQQQQDIVSEPIYLCKCLLSGDSSEQVVVSPRKKKILSTVTRTEEYLRERRIPELIRFLLTKVIAHAPTHPVSFLQKLLDDCMLYRSGHGQAPVLYEERHLQAVVKSFDPGSRGWLSSGQVRRAFTTLGLNPPDKLDERTPCDVVLNNLQETQELELFKLISAGFFVDDGISMDDCQCNSSCSNNNI